MQPCAIMTLYHLCVCCLCCGYSRNMFCCGFSYSLELMLLLGLWIGLVWGWVSVKIRWETTVCAQCMQQPVSFLHLPKWYCWNAFSWWSGLKKRIFVHLKNVINVYEHVFHGAHHAYSHPLCKWVLTDWHAVYGYSRHQWKWERSAVKCLSGLVHHIHHCYTQFQSVYNFDIFRSCNYIRSGDGFNVLPKFTLLFDSAMLVKLAAFPSVSYMLVLALCGSC